MYENFLIGIIIGAVTTTDLTPGFRGEVWELVLHAGPVAKVVLVILLLMSVACWGIAFFKYLTIRAAIKESIDFLNLFWESSLLSRTYQEAKKFQQSPLAEIFRSGFIELERFKKPLRTVEGENRGADPAGSRAKLFGISSIKRALDQAATAELSRLEKNLGFLATTGSTAPFIGLFGTVWGIMDSFRQIGIRGSANLATVAPGISEALIATAFGLVAAIPAVVAYNYFVGKIKMISSEMENFSAEFLNIIERHFEAQKPYGHEHRT